MTMVTLPEIFNGKNSKTTTGRTERLKINAQRRKWQRRLKMKFHSNIIPREKRSQINIFKCKTSAVMHLHNNSIEPDPNCPSRYIMIAERTYPDKTFDALDYLMYEHGYDVRWV